MRTITKTRSTCLEIARSTGVFTTAELEMLVTDLWSEDGLIFLSGADNEAFAQLHPLPLSPSSAIISWVAVSKEYQGLGYGRKMIDTVVEYARNQGITHLYIETSNHPQFDGARRLYERCWFTPIATMRHYYGIGNSKVIYCKDLT